MSTNYDKDKYIAKQRRIKYAKKKLEAKKKNEKIIKVYRKKTIMDPIHKIISSLAVRALVSLKRSGVVKIFGHMEMLGCDVNKLKKHLSDKFKSGMSFDNYGEWEVDHIKPIASFDLTDENELKKCFNYKNLQPLWMKENRIKSSKIIK